MQYSLILHESSTSKPGKLEVRDSSAIQKSRRFANSVDLNHSSEDSGGCGYWGLRRSTRRVAFGPLRHGDGTRSFDLRAVPHTINASSAFSVRLFSPIGSGSATSIFGPRI